MKLKITYTQLDCLCSLLNATLGCYTPDDNIERLLYTHMYDLYKRLVKRFIDQSKNYTVDMPNVVAIAFYEFWQKVNIEDIYARSFIQGILNEIDKNNLVKSI